MVVNRSLTECFKLSAVVDVQISRETLVSECFKWLRKLFDKTVVLPRILSDILRPRQYSGCLNFFFGRFRHLINTFASAQRITLLTSALYEKYLKFANSDTVIFSTVDQSKKIGSVCMEHKPTRFLQAIYFISLTGWRNFTRKVYIVFGTDFSLQQIHRLLSYQGEFFLRNPCFLTKTMYREKKS